MSRPLRKQFDEKSTGHLWTCDHILFLLIKAAALCSQQNSKLHNTPLQHNLQTEVAELNAQQDSCFAQYQHIFNLSLKEQLEQSLADYTTSSNPKHR